MNNAKAEMSEGNDFKTLWGSFKEKPYTISLNQAKLLLKGLSQLNELNEPIIDNILWSIKVPDNFIDTVMATRHHSRPPNRRLVLSKLEDTSIFAAVVWEKGCCSNIHNHSHFGLTRTLIGSVTSIGFRKTKEGFLTCVGKVPFERNRVYHVPAGQSFIHSIANFKDKPALELHFYGPLKDEASYRFEPDDYHFNVRQVKDGDVIPCKVVEDSKQFIDRFE